MTCHRAGIVNPDRRPQAAIHSATLAEEEPCCLVVPKLKQLVLVDLWAGLSMPVTYWIDRPTSRQVPMTRAYQTVLTVPVASPVPPGSALKCLRLAVPVGGMMQLSG